MAMSGAREGPATWFRRLLARAMARDLAAFVVPGPEIARAHGLDLGAAGLRPVATPRHAGVLLLVGELPEGLARAATVAYAQMPRPRAIVALGAGDVGPLPAPDVALPLEQAALAGGVAELRRLFAVDAFGPATPDFAVAAVRMVTQYTCPMHPEVVQSAPGSCPICGMDLVSRESAGAVMDHSAHDATTIEHGGHGVAAVDRGAMEQGGGQAAGAYTCPMHPEIVRDEPGRCPICGMRLVSRVAGAAHGHGDATAMVDGVHVEHDERAKQDGAADREGPGRAGHDTAGTVHDGHEVATGRRQGHDRGAADPPVPTGEGFAASHATHGGITMPAPPGAATATATGHDARDMGAMDHAGHGVGAMGGDGHGEHDTGAMRRDRHDVGTVDQSTHDMAPLGHAGHDMTGMDHGMHDMSGGFMSMVAMTRDLPRSRDGLPMEWVEAPFGPLFPGLPGGLGLTLTLDGDVVARAVVTPGAASRGLDATWPGPAATLPERLARLDPLSPFSYRLLAARALEAAAGVVPDERTARARVRALERERAASHLGWLAGFGELLGGRWLAERAAGLQLALLRAADPADIARVGTEIGRLIGGVERTPLIGRRLDGIGRLSAGDAVQARGPVARAGGVATDARADDPIYLDFGFAPVVREGDDALARLRVRLAELAQSLDFTRAAGAPIADSLAVRESGGAGGHGMARIETPRGAATLHLVLDGGAVREAQLDTPSTAHTGLVNVVVEGRELADALVGVASLDLSPWELDR